MVDEITGTIGALDWNGLLATVFKLALIITLGLGILRTARTHRLREEPPDYTAFAWMLTSGVRTLMIGLVIGIASGRRSLHREIFDR